MNIPVEASGFQIRPPAEGLRGTDPMNICHRGKLRHGVQLEIGRRVRDVLRANKDQLQTFVHAVRKGIQLYLGLMSPL